LPDERQVEKRTKIEKGQTAVRGQNPVSSVTGGAQPTELIPDLHASSVPPEKPMPDESQED
jgi:hypothetical protein